MCNHLFRNYRIMSVMFWSFPYLLWRAFDHWSGFVVGVVVAIVLTVMLNTLFHPASLRRQSLSLSELDPPRQDAEEYQRGYRAEMKFNRPEPHLPLERELQPVYEEMQVLYPEMPPLARQ